MSVWLTNHFWLLFGGVGGAAVVALIGWLLKSRFSPETPAAIDNSHSTNSAVAAGSNISQRNFSPDYNFTVPFLPSGAPGRERYDEWRELSHELHEALNQIGYVFFPVNAVTPGIETNDYEAGISRGYKVIRNRLAIADTVAREKVLEKYQELVKYAVSAESPREPNQRGCPTVVGFNLKARAFEDELMEIARKDIAQPSFAPPLPETPKAVEPVPNFVYVGGKRKPVFVAPWASEGCCDPRTEERRKLSIDAFVLKFENRKSDSDRKLRRALNVIAKLKFHHKNGATARDIDYGIWLNSPCNSTDIGVGDTRELLLMSVMEKNRLVTFEDRRIGNRDFSSGEWSYLDSPDIEGYDRVDITLIDQTSQATFSIKLKFWREGANFCTAEI